MNVRKLGWVGLLAVAVMSGFVLRGTDLRRADAADQPGDNKIVVISSNSAPPYSYFEGEAHVGFEVDFWNKIAAAITHRGLYFCKRLLNIIAELACIWDVRIHAGGAVFAAKDTFYRFLNSVNINQRGAPSAIWPPRIHPRCPKR